MSMLEPTVIWSDGVVGFTLDAPDVRPKDTTNHIYGYVYAATLITQDQRSVRSDELRRRLIGKTVAGVTIRAIELFAIIEQRHRIPIGVVFEERLPKTVEITI